MQESVLTTIVLPVSLAIIMLGVGMGLTFADFRRVVERPKAAAIGLFSQMILLPLVGFIIVSSTNLDPVFAVGLMILALCPGGVTSNIYSYLARADVALSVSLTAVVSLLAPFTIPLLATMAISSLMGESAAIVLPMKKTIMALLVITIVPVSIGMALKHFATRFVAAAEKPLRIFSTVILFLIIAGIVKQNIAVLREHFMTLAPMALLLNVSTMALGFAIARAFKLKRAQATTISLEVGLQNGTTALLVTSTILSNQAMSVPPAIYSILMFFTGGLFVFLVREKKTSDAPAAAAS